MNSDEPMLLQDVLADAAEILKSHDEIVLSIREQSVLKALEAMSKHDEIKSLAVPLEVADSITVDRPDGPRNGATFIKRPRWLEKSDRFTVSENTSASLDGWRKPGKSNAGLVKAIERFLRHYGEREEGAEVGPHSQVLSDRLSMIDLSKENLVVTTLPFLKKVTLVHIELFLGEGLGWWDGIFYVAPDEDGGYEVDSFDYGSSRIHMLNAKFKLKIAGNELLYLRYFMHITRGVEGTFRIVDADMRVRLSSLLKSEIEESEGIKNILGELWHPPILVGVSHDGALVYQAILLYAGTIFISLLALREDGVIGMLGDEQAVETYSKLLE